MAQLVKVRFKSWDLSSGRHAREERERTGGRGLRHKKRGGETPEKREEYVPIENAASIHVKSYHFCFDSYSQTKWLMISMLAAHNLA